MGANPGDLPVQNPTKYDLMTNLKTAKALRVSFPPSVIAIADRVIEYGAAISLNGPKRRCG